LFLTCLSTFVSWFVPVECSSLCLLLYRPSECKALSKRWIRGWSSLRAAKRRAEPASPDRRAALLFTASHGLEYGQPTEAQYASQGALLFQEWSGPFTTPTPDHYLAADQLSDDTSLAGTVAFCFACYSAGTPLKEDWVLPTWFRRPARLADTPFVARLPQKLLAYGLLSFVGHVSRAWDYSFLGVRGASGQIGMFACSVQRSTSCSVVGASDMPPIT
jgi:hypothetical protein